MIEIVLPSLSDGVEAVPASPVEHSAKLPAVAQHFGPYRVMNIGSALLTGDGSEHSKLLSDSVMRRLTDLVGHEFEIASHFTPQSTLRTLEQEIPGPHLSQFDAVIVWLDQRASRAAAATVAHHVNGLVEDLWLQVVPGTTITLILPPLSITGWSAQRAADLALELNARVNDLIRIVQLLDQHGNRAVRHNYDNWADAIAETVATGLLDPLDELKPTKALRP